MPAVALQVAGGMLSAFAKSVSPGGSPMMGTWAYMIIFGFLQVLLAMVRSSAGCCYPPSAPPQTAEAA